MTFNEALEEIKAESEEYRAIIEEAERMAVLLNEAEKIDSQQSSSIVKQTAAAQFSFTTAKYKGDRP